MDLQSYLCYACSRMPYTPWHLNTALSHALCSLQQLQQLRLVGTHNIVIPGGMESMSKVPHHLTAILAQSDLQACLTLSVLEARRAHLLHHTIYCCSRTFCFWQALMILSSLAAWKACLMCHTTSAKPAPAIAWGTAHWWME